jgi:hypothetical protein
MNIFFSKKSKCPFSSQAFIQLSSIVIKMIKAQQQFAKYLEIFVGSIIHQL